MLSDGFDVVVSILAHLEGNSNPTLLLCPLSSCKSFHSSIYEMLELLKLY